jgi:hypothetical protein
MRKAVLECTFDPKAYQQENELNFILCQDGILNTLLSQDTQTAPFLDKLDAFLRVILA